MEGPFPSHQSLARYKALLRRREALLERLAEAERALR